MAETNSGPGGSVFISYSRKDKEFVQKLNDALDKAGVPAWVDWEGIELASDWMATISEAIQNSDAFVFVISPDSLKSRVCTDELELGLKFNKKLIPVLYREPPKKTTMHEKLAATNWVYLRTQDNFDETLPRLVESVNTDLVWVRQHTQLLGQAREWEGNDRNNGFLLTGTKLHDAERWMAEATGQENRQVLPLQAEYINTSRIIATRNQRRLTITMSFLVVAALVFGVVALLARNQANEQRIAADHSRATAVSSGATAVANEHVAATQRAIAVANENDAKNKTILANAARSAAQAQILQSRSGNLDTSTLLAIESYKLQPDFKAENLIRINASLMAMPVAQMHQDGAIWNIEWSPDYEYFVTGNNTDPANKQALNQACVYRASDGKVRYCVEHANDVNDAVFTRDGQYLITASADQTVKFWNAADGKFVKELDFGGAVLDLDVSDSVLAIARQDDFLTLDYLNKPDLKPVDVAQADGVKAVKFSPSGEYLAIGLQNGQVRFWQARNNFFYNGTQHPRSSYVVLAWSPDNLWLASGGGDSVARLSKRDGTLQHTVVHQDWVEGVAFGPDPSWYATASDDNIIRVIDTATGTERFRMSHTHFAQKVIVSSDGRWIASTGYDRVVRIWDSISGTELLEIPLKGRGSAISFNRDNSRIVAADENGDVTIWDISSLDARVGTIGFTEFVREARFTPSGESLIVNADDYHVWKIPADQVDTIGDGTRGTVILTAQSLTYNTAISPDSKWVAVVELDTEDLQKNRGTLVSIDGKTQRFLEHGGEVTAVAFTADSKLVATAGVDGLVWFWDVDSGKRQFSLDNSEKVQSLTISPADPLTLTGLHDKIRVWDTATHRPIAELPQPGDIVSMAMSRDGKYLATGSAEGTVFLWKADGNTFTRFGDVLRLNGYARTLTFSSDGHWLAGGDSTGYAYLWDLATAQEMARIPHGSNPVTSVSFSPDDSQLLTVSRKMVRIWNISALRLTPRDDLITAACSHIVANLSAGDWINYFPDEEYRFTCPDLPQEK